MIEVRRSRCSAGPVKHGNRSAAHGGVVVISESWPSTITNWPPVHRNRFPAAPFKWLAYTSGGARSGRRRAIIAGRCADLPKVVRLPSCDQANRVRASLAYDPDVIPIPPGWSEHLHARGGRCAGHSSRRVVPPAEPTRATLRYPEGPLPSRVPYDRATPPRPAARRHHEHRSAPTEAGTRCAASRRRGRPPLV